MKKRNRILPVCLAGGIVMLCTVGLIVSASVTGNMNDDTSAPHSDGNKTAKTDETESPILVPPDPPSLDKTRVDIDFTAQYIRTDGYHEEMEYPMVRIIRSADELHAYYEANRDRYNLERRSEVSSDSTVGFLDACEKYDDAYFAKQILVMVLLEEGSGSTRHQVKAVSLAENTQMTVDIETITPEIGTCDMAQWHILIEPKAAVGTKDESDVTVLLDGSNPKTQPVTVRESNGYANITLTIPHDWHYETEQVAGCDDFCIAIWPAEHTMRKIKVWYLEAFGVCGTGLETESITLGNYQAYMGTYDNSGLWTFIQFTGTPGTYVVMNEGAQSWWDAYGEEAMQILSTVVLGDGIIDEAEAIAIAEKEVTVPYDQIRATYQAESGFWTVCFFQANTVGGDQVFTVTHEGKIIEVVFGE